MSQSNIYGENRPEITRAYEVTPELSPARVQQQMELILESKHFRQAKSLDKFLRYVVTRKLAGAENELKEFTIGLDVFRRGADYDPRHDAVVRVQANVLRKRLASYYQEEGARDELIIELPKGHYVPKFSLKPVSRELPGLVEEPVASSLTKQSSGLLSTLHSPRGGGSWLIAVTFILGLLTAFAFQQWQGKGILAEKNIGSASPAAYQSYLPFWEKFFEPGVENVLAYGTPQFFSANGVFLRDVEINSPQEASLSSRLMSLRIEHENSATSPLLSRSVEHGS